MKPHKLASLVCALVWTVVLLASAAEATTQEQPATDGKPRETRESLRPWQWLHELHKPKAAETDFADCLLPPGILDKARLDLADLRLRDAQDREVPFALRIRTPQVVQKSLPHTLINQGTVAKDSAVTGTLDLGDGRVDHNAVEIATGGTDFRRRVEVEGSDSADKDWVVLLDQAVVMHVRTATQVLEARRLEYAPSRFRYLRIRVFPDRNLADDNPKISNVTVSWLTRSPGQEVTRPAHLGTRADVSVDGRPGSAWSVEFAGMTVPCSQLSFDVADAGFARPYRLELVTPNEPNRVIAQGEWRRSGEEKKPLEVRLDAEVVAGRLRLVVTDDRNPPLNLTAVRYRAAARQVVFEVSGNLGWPLRVYFGNPQGKAANYDFARFLPETLTPARAEWASAGVVDNPVYAPGPTAWIERRPWFVYALLGAVSLLLLGILVMLARRPLPKTDAKHSHV